MKSVKKTILSVALVLTCCITSTLAKTSSVRERIRMDQGWRFMLGDVQYTPGGVTVTGWRWKVTGQAFATAPESLPAEANANTADWKDAAPNEDVFRGRVGFVWYQTALPTTAGPRHALHFETVDDNAVIYLNGRRIARHEGWDDPFEVSLDGAWNVNGPNVVTVLVENTAGQGGITGPVLMQTDNSPSTAGAIAPNFNDRGWQQVNVPHDFIIDTPFDPTADQSHGYHPKGIGWYRKEFTLPTSDRGKT
ncbi:MAG: hypothetical protein JOZ57_03480, partial [Abitibacteriaceae bacterium]|nr:hypothetical protein [Abditibacteriaceae bacterium]